MVLCSTWSETSVALSQLTQFWQIPRQRTLSYSLCTPFFVTTTPSGGTCKYAKAPSTKKSLRVSLPIDMFLSALSFLAVAQSSSEVPEGLMNNPVHAAPHLTLVIDSKSFFFCCFKGFFYTLTISGYYNVPALCFTILDTVMNHTHSRHPTGLAP